ncbi:hypothetical protein [Candidatus Poriferisodalis sp.]|uniref:hypothetical protein n=1 Tax=Candidatus Poriferisodalis sp. TaxID=3101277 RepID=UPI003B0204BE
MSMFAGPTVRGDGAGQAVLVKHAVGAMRRRLHHEAQVLCAARLEGVVECVGLDELDERCELRLRYVEAVTLAEQPPLGAYEVLDVLIELGRTVAQLHARGIRHGALRAEHVLLAPPHRPVLCGFGEATGPSDQSQHPTSVDLAAIAVIAASELARAHDATTESGERRCCVEAQVAAERLARAAGSADNHSDPLAEWLARLDHIRSSRRAESPSTSGGFTPARPFAETWAHAPSQRSTHRATDQPAHAATHAPTPSSTHPRDELRERLRTQVTNRTHGTHSDMSHDRAAASTELSHDETAMPERRRVVPWAALAAVLVAASFVAWRALVSSGAGVAAADRPAANDATSTAMSASLRVGTAADADHAGMGDAGTDGSDAHIAATSSGDGRDLLGSASATETSAGVRASRSDGATLIYGTDDGSADSPQGGRTGHLAPGDCARPLDAESRAPVGHADSSANRERSDLRAVAPGDESTADRDDDTARHNGQIDAGNAADAAWEVQYADVRGDGCLVAVYVGAPATDSDVETSGADAPAARVRSPDGEWTVGAVGDLVAIGNWACDGRSTVAAVSPSTGIVSFFGSWPRSGQPVMPTRVAHVPFEATAVSVVRPTAAVAGRADGSWAPSAPDGSASQETPEACDALVVHYGELSLTVARFEPAASAASWLRRR